MTNKEIRMRCIEAVSTMGVREPSRMVTDAKILEEWVLAAPADKEATPPKARRKASPTADKEQSPA